MGDAFLLETNYYRACDQLTLKDGEGVFKLEVISVRKNVIQFRDLKTNELLRLNLLQEAPRFPESKEVPTIPSHLADEIIEL